MQSSFCLSQFDASLPVVINVLFFSQKTTFSHNNYCLRGFLITGPPSRTIHTIKFLIFYLGESNPDFFLSIIYIDTQQYEEYFNLNFLNCLTIFGGGLKVTPVEVRQEAWICCHFIIGLTQ